MFRLAHVTDPHFRSFAGAHFADFLGKRAVGALNVVVNRRRKHKMELLDALGEDLRLQEADHVALTGDLSNVSLEAEWRSALRWVEALGGSPAAVTIIPGNHDAYVPDVVARGDFEKLFGAYQTSDPVARAESASAPGPGDGDVRGEGGRGSYPFVRFRGPLALVSMNSCVATGDMGAWGDVGSAQLRRTEALLNSPELTRKTRVVLLHHPPVRHKGGEDRNLKDRQAVCDMLARAGADLVLHGHDHRDESTTVAGPGTASIPVVGAGSASYAGGSDRRARYNIYEFDRDTITAVVRSHDEATDTFREVRRVRLK